MYIRKEFIKDFESTKLDAMFRRTAADIKNLMKEAEEQKDVDVPHLAFSQYTESLTSLKNILVNDTRIENDELIFDHFEDFQEAIVPKIKLLVQFLNEQFKAGKLYLVEKYEIEFFEMFAEM